MNNEKNKEAISKRPDEITFRRLLLKLKEYFFYIIYKWWIVVIFVTGFAANDYIEVNQITPIYSGTTVLLLKFQDLTKENKAEILIYSQFANAQFTIKKILLEPYEKDSSELLINAYLHTYFELKPHGLPASIPTDFRFTHANCNTFTILEKQVFKDVTQKIMTHIAGYADGFINVSVDDALGMITLAIATPSEELTFAVINNLRRKWEEITLEKAVFAENSAYKSFRAESDSLEARYRLICNELLQRRNQYAAIIRANEESKSKRRKFLQEKISYLEVDADIYKMNYLATIESLRGAQNNLKLNLPIIEVLEETLPPIPAAKPSAISAAIKGGIMGAILAILLIIIVKVFMDVLEEEE
ncbi:MAG: hypothetical protein ACI920_002407 [Saprospiraceae bacterium]|jgi:hypothetical protein